MTADARVILTADGPALCGVLTEGGTALRLALAADQQGVLAALESPSVPLIRLDLSPDTPVPCPVRPDAGQKLAGLTQTAPPDQASALCRLALIGFLSANTSWDGVAVMVMPERSHWLHISAEEVVSFQSTLTPGLITALNGDRTPDMHAVAETLSRPERLAVMLARADASMTTGALIGAELAALRPYWLGQQVALLSAPGTPDYRPALEAQGVPVTSQPLLTALSLGLRACPEVIS